MGSGNKLKELLKKKNMTVADLSRKTKISAQTLYSIINRDSAISYENRLLIAEALNVDINELREIKTIEIKIPDKAIDMIVNDISKKEPSQKARLLNNTEMGKTPLFTIPTKSERPTKNNPPSIKILDENYFKHISQKEERGQNLTQEEKEYKSFFLSESLKGIGIKFAEYYCMLNEKGQKKADVEINRTLEFLMLISQIAEYRKEED